jgi:hypothetical protein
MPDQLVINVGGSALTADLDNLQPWRALLNCADSIAVQRSGREMLRVDLSGHRRWIVFKRNIGGSPLICIGHQETIGVRRVNGRYIGGSNRKTLAWLHPNGRIEVE